MKDGQLRTDLGSANSVRTLFKPGSWLSKIDFVNHLVLFNNILITILAEKEGGKTAFGSLLLNNLDPQIKPVFMTAKPPCSREDIVGDIAAQLHLNLDVDSDVSSIVAQINERKAHVLVIIDDAQHIAEQVLKEFLMAIRGQDDFGFFHLCLVSDYSVVAALNNFTTDQFANLVHTIELGALNEGEARTYVLQKAMAARLINKPLTDVQFKQFYQLTKGNVAKINANLESFIFKCTTHQSKGKAKLLTTLGVAASFAIVSIVSYVYMHHSYQASSTNEAPSSLLPINEALRESQHVTLTQQASLPSFIPSLHEEAVTQLVYNGLPKKQMLTESDNQTVVGTVALVDKVIVIPTVQRKASRLADTSSTHEQKLQQPTRISRSSVPVPALAKNEVVVGNNKAKTNATTVGAAKYTIQITASHNKSDIYRFKKSSKLYAATTVRHFTNQKGSWYILTIGEYNTRVQAQASASKLPKELAKLKPWVRPVLGLKNIG